MKKRNQTIVNVRKRREEGIRSKQKRKIKNKRKVHFDGNKLRNPEWSFIFKRDLKQIVELMKFQLSYFKS